MAADAPAAFFSYCRDDSDFALRLAEDLKAAGAAVWIDQLDIEPGMRWDRAVEDALNSCPRMLVILSPASVESDNVRDEISFALRKQKTIIPVLYLECDIPLRLERHQHIDFRTDHARGLKGLLKALGIAEPTPSTVYAHREQDRQAEKSGMTALRRRRESRIQIGDPIHFEYTIAQITTHAYRIPIRNTSQTETIKNVNVSLTDIKPQPPEYTWGSTMRLHWKDDNRPKDAPPTFKFTRTRDLQAGTPEEIDFVFASVGAAEIFVFHTVENIDQRIPRPAEKYRMTVEAKGDNVPSETATFDVWIQNGVLQCQAAKQERATRATRTYVAAQRRVTVPKVEDRAKPCQLRELRTLTGHAGSVMAAAVTLDGQRAVSASGAKTLKVWELVSGRELLTLAGHTAPVYGVAVTPDGKRAVSASEDATLKVWDLENGRSLCTLQGHSDYVYGVAVTPDGKRAVSTSRDNTLKVWELETGRVLRTLEGHTHSVLGVAVTPDGKRAVSASSDDTLKVWELVSGGELASFQVGTQLYCCAVSSDGKTILAGDRSGVIHCLRLE